jgi:transposase InsO family protein
VTSRVLEPFAELVGELTQRGRPARDAKHEQLAAEVDVMRELLDVVTNLLKCANVESGKIRDQVIGAWNRLSQRGTITQERFCEAIALSTRTLRDWLGRAAKKPKAVAPLPKPPVTKRKRPPRRRRFGFDVTLPDTQVGADTTDVRAFGVPLKLIAAQDIGGRDEALFDAIIVDETEDAHRVFDILKQSCNGLSGTQVITDQGKPYMARWLREALAEQSMEHAPQKEGDPIGKSTVERAFLTVKSIASPIFEITNHVASAMPELCNPELAKSGTRILFGAILRAYQYGARAAHRALEARGTITSEELARLAEQSRERARAMDRSARLFLEHVHQIYAFPGVVQSFVDSLRRYPVEVLQNAERALRSQMHRDDIRDKRSYFAALVRRFHDEYVIERRRKEADRLAMAQDELNKQSQQVQSDALNNRPAERLRQSLECLVMQWSPKTNSLLFGGDGLGLGWLRRALEQLSHIHGTAAIDIANGVLHEFRATNLDRLGSSGIRAIELLFQRELHSRLLASKRPCTEYESSSIFPITGVTRRRPVSIHLRI